MLKYYLFLKVLIEAINFINSELGWYHVNKPLVPNNRFRLLFAMRGFYFLKIII